MSKPKNWGTLSNEEQEAWRENERERTRKWKLANKEKVREELDEFATDGG